MSIDEATPAALSLPQVPSTGSRRGTLAALLAGSALGLAALGSSPSTEAAKRHKGKHRNKRNKSKGGKKNGGKGNVGDSSSSIRMVETTTVFEGSGVAQAISKCPEGYVPINGGFFTSAPRPDLLTSSPRLDENAWLIEIDGAVDGGQITVVAVCLAGTVVVDEAERRRSGKSGREMSK